MKHFKLLTRILPLFTAVLVAASLHAATPVLVVHPELDLPDVETAEVRRIFLGSTSRIAGTPVVLAVQESGAVHEAFLKQTLSKTPQQFTSHWRKIVFSGKGKMPRSFSSDAEVVAFVAATPGAIGYVETGAMTEGVTRVEVP